MSQYGIVIFPTTSAVMQAEKKLIQAGLKIKIVPVPREFSSDCGLSLRFDWDSAEKVRALLAEGRVEYEDIHSLK